MAEVSYDDQAEQRSDRYAFGAATDEFVELPAFWMASGVATNVRIETYIFNNGNVTLLLRGETDTSFGATGPELSDECEAGLVITWEDSGGAVATVTGITGTDQTEPYRNWTPSDPAEHLGTIAFIQQLVANELVTVTLRYDEPGLRIEGSLEGAGGTLSGALTLGLGLSISGSLDGDGGTLSGRVVLRATGPLGISGSVQGAGGTLSGTLTLGRTTGPLSISGSLEGAGGTLSGRLFGTSPNITTPWGEWVIHIAGLDVSDWVQKDTVRIERPLRQRSEISFDMEVPLDDAPPLADWPKRKPLPYSLVQAWWRTHQGDTLAFSGPLYSAPVTFDASANWFSYSGVRAPSLAARLDNRRIEGYERTIGGEQQSQLIARLGQKYAGDEGIDFVSGVIATDVVVPDVFDWIKVSEFLDRLADQSNSVWCVSPAGILLFYPRVGLQQASATLSTGTNGNIASLHIEDDLQRHRTRQTVIGGGATRAGQLVQKYALDGTTREFQLRYRLDRIIDVALDGASQDFGPESDGFPWIIDSDRSVVVHRSSQPLLTSGELEVTYDYKRLILTTSSASSALVNRYGIIHDVLRDSAIETNPEADSVRDRELQRHDSPTTLLRATIDYARVAHLQEGEQVRLNVPEMGIVNEDWLLAALTLTSEGSGLIYDVDLIAEDYEHLEIDYYRRLQQLTEPTEVDRPLRTGGNREIDPDLLLHEGFRLPAHMGGEENSPVRTDQWVRVPGSGIIVVDGTRLPEDLMEWTCTAVADDLPAGVMGQIRLYNITDGSAVPNSDLDFSSSAARPYIKRGLSAAAKTAWYELQCRCTVAQSRRGGSIKVWNGKYDTRA